MALPKKQREDTEYSWMDTYGDLVTLVLTFFILLFSFSSIDNKKFQLIRAAFSNTGPAVIINALDATEIMGMGGKFSIPTFERKKLPKEPPQHTPAPQSNDYKETQGDPTIEQQIQNIENNFNELFERIQQYVKEKGLIDALSVERDGDIITIQVTAQLLFPSGSADVLADAKTILEDIGTMLAINLDGIRLIRVEGHTDNVPIHNARFEDNWDLSAKRATNTVRYLSKSSEIPMDLFSAMGYGEYKPIDTNDTAEGRAKNRRVTFVIEKQILDNI